MSKVYIFGDSFSTPHRYGEYPWITQLSKKYTVINFSDGGLSNQDILLNFLEHIDEITSYDVVIVGFTDPNRTYISDKKNPSAYKTYLELFYNPTISQVHYEGCLNKVKQLALEKQLKLLVYWSFPSDYKNRESHYSWSERDFYKLTPDDFVYSVKFDNEIKPALIYFSRQEIQPNLTDKQVTTYFTRDIRPNHISDMDIHNQLFNFVDKFINNDAAGQMIIQKRENNGS